MKQIFNPAIDVDKYGNELSPFLPPKERKGEDKPIAKDQWRVEAGRKGGRARAEKLSRERRVQIARNAGLSQGSSKKNSTAIRTIEGFEIRSGVPVPGIKKKAEICRWERLHKAMKVGDCVAMDKKQANTFQVWAKNHGKKVVTRTIGGETLVFKMRKDHSTKKEK